MCVRKINVSARVKTTPYLPGSNEKSVTDATKVYSRTTKSEELLVEIVFVRE